MCISTFEGSNIEKRSWYQRNYPWRHLGNHCWSSFSIRLFTGKQISYIYMIWKHLIIHFFFSWVFSYWAILKSWLANFRWPTIAITILEVIPWTCKERWGNFSSYTRSHNLFETLLRSITRVDGSAISKKHSAPQEQRIAGSLLPIVLALFWALFCLSSTFFYILSQKALLAFFLIFDWLFV